MPKPLVTSIDTLSHLISTDENQIPIIRSPYFSVEEILHEFQTDATSGLSQIEAEKRTIEFGANIYQTQKQKSILLMILLQFKSPIVYLLLLP